MLELAFIALGGALGGICRVWVDSLVSEAWGDRFPWGTLVVNGSGSLIIGAVAATVQVMNWLHELPWVVVMVGIVGSYTTVSSFSLRTLSLLGERKWPSAMANIVGSTLLCIGASSGSFVVTMILLKIFGEK